MSIKDEKLENLDEVNFKFKVLTTKTHQINNENGEGQYLIDQSRKFIKLMFEYLNFFLVNQMTIIILNVNYVFCPKKMKMF